MHSNHFSAGNKFLMLRISDLEAVQTGVFLFGGAYDTHMSLDRGTVVMLLGPKIMEPKVRLWRGGGGGQSLCLRSEGPRPPPPQPL